MTTFYTPDAANAHRRHHSEYVAAGRCGTVRCPDGWHEMWVRYDGSYLHVHRPEEWTETGRQRHAHCRQVFVAPYVTGREEGT